MRRYIRAVLASAAGLLLVIGGTTAAAAGDDLWPDTADCAVGAFTDQVIRPPDDLGPVLELRGWVGPCSPSEKDPDTRVRGRYGFAYVGWTTEYTSEQKPTIVATGRVFDKRLRPYAAELAPTQFAGRFDFSAGESLGDREAAICLMRDTDTRLACLIVELGEDAPTVTPVSVDDPRVRARMRLVQVGGSTSPNCGTCL